MPRANGSNRCAVKSALLAALLAAGVSVYAADQGTQAELSQIEAVLLDVHNEERAAQHVPPLVWDRELANAARFWAENLAKSGRFEHADAELDSAKQGENLWMGTRDAFTPQEMVGGWIEERKFVKSGRFPEVSTTGDWADVGHYTQLIWPTTERVGCSVANGREDSVLVCRYFPAGNWLGVPLNVNPHK